MTNVGPGLVYGLFVLAGPLVLGLPIAVACLLVARRAGGFHRSLALVVVALGGLGGIAAIGTGMDPYSARIPFGLGIAYVVVPLAIAGAILHYGGGLEPDEAARRATGGWLIAVVLLVVLLVLASTPFWDALGRTPSVFGMAWFSGFVALMALVGIVAAGVGWLLPARWPVVARG